MEKGGQLELLPPELSRGWHDGGGFPDDLCFGIGGLDKGVIQSAVALLLCLQVQSPNQEKEEKIDWLHEIKLGYLLQY